MQADIRNLHIRYICLEFFFQLFHNHAGQLIIIVFCQILAPVFIRFDNLVFHNPVNRNGNMDNQPHIRIFCQRQYFIISHPGNTVHHALYNIMIQNLPETASF